MAFKVNSWEID